jgi:hypothetical protein
VYRPKEDEITRGSRGIRGFIMSTLRHIKLKLSNQRRWKGKGI